MQAALVNLTVRVCDNDCDEMLEVSLVCAVTDLHAAEYGIILPTDVVYKLKATTVTVNASCDDVSVTSDPSL